jgi:hypothetical protein
MMPNPTLYRISPAEKRETLTVNEVWSQDGASPLASGYKQIVPTSVAGHDYLLAFDDSGNGSAFRVTAKAPWIEPVASKLSLGGPADIVEPFLIGNNPHLLAYTAEQGTMSFIPIASDLSSQPAYHFARKRAPVTTGFTVTKPLVFNGLVYVLGYSFATGEVDIFSLNVTATPQPGAKPGTPPLLMRPVWVHQWARNWTRFAFFTLGAENFFFKINVGKINVNIDHIMDDPGTGTVEVGTYLQNQLDDPKGVEIVEPFTMNGGDPCFVTYRKDGRTDFHRIHSDCQGWTKQAGVDAATGVTQIVPYPIGDERFQLFY